MNSKKQQRDDLQCWRSFAILGVLFFHLWPTSFPNGYVGVDIFFVLSGFLMAMIFPVGRKLEAKDLKEFYFRRIKRIVPVYLVAILGTLVFLARSTLLREYQEIKGDSKWAVVFATNFQDSSMKLDYFDMRSKHRFFRHCWSLAVEMQFYLIFPFIGFLRSKVNPQIYQLILLIIFLLSITFQLQIDDPILKYESLLSRIWEFSAGILAQSMTIKPNQNIAFLASLIAVGLIFMPYPILTPLLSFFGVICASTAVAFSSTEEHPFKFIIHSIFQYLILLGDISYVLYLIHWPIITYAYSLSANGVIINLFDGFLLAITCVVLAVALNQIVEKPMLKFCNNLKKLGVILGILYLCVLGLPEMLKHLSFNTSFQSSTTKQFLHSAEKLLNHPMKFPPNWSSINDIEANEWMIKKGNKVGDFRRCNFEKSVHLPEMPSNLIYCEMNTNPEATYTALIIGNSFASNIKFAIAGNPAFRKVILAAAVGCPFPYVAMPNDGKEHCKKPAEAMRHLIKEIEHDVVFLLQSYFGYISSPLENNWTQNWRFKVWNETFQFIQKHSGALILNKEQVVFPWNVAAEFSKRKFHGQPFDGRMRIPARNSSLKKRLKAIKCPKCFWFTYTSLYCGKNYCDSLDAETGLPMLYDKNHLSLFGLRKIKPIFDDTAAKALKFIQKNKIV